MAHEFGLNHSFVLALLVGTLQRSARFQPFFEQVRAAAIGAFFRHRLGPGHEVAVGIAAASVKRLAAMTPEIKLVLGAHNIPVAEPSVLPRLETVPPPKSTETLNWPVIKMSLFLSTATAFA